MNNDRVSECLDDILWSEDGKLDIKEYWSTVIMNFANVYNSYYGTDSDDKDLNRRTTAVIELVEMYKNKYPALNDLIKMLKEFKKELSKVSL